MRWISAILLVVLLALLPMCPDRDSEADVAEVGKWGPVLDWGMQAMHLVVLGGGSVLALSNRFQAGVWDPKASKAPVPVAFSAGDLHCAAQATLADGRAIVVGGTENHVGGGEVEAGIPVTALFDPATKRWSRGADMQRARWYPTATTLSDGRLFVTSGSDPHGEMVRIPEIYDPAANSWTALPAASRLQPFYPFMFLLPDGRLFEAGPERGTWFLDPGSRGAWTSGPRNDFFGQGGALSSAVQYGPGRILIAGGGDPAISRSAVIDLTQPSPAWREIESMKFPRRRFTLALLADGSVLAVGGTRRGDDVDPVMEPELWDPKSERWTTVAAMRESRMYHSTAALLPDGRVVVGGGESAGRLHAQVYSPPYLFRGPRPAIRSAPAVTAYAAVFAIETLRSSDVDRVALVRPAAVTHGFDHNQRYVPLAFERSGAAVRVVAPADGNVAPPGDYLLFIIDRRGVPSEGHWIRLGSAFR